MPPFGGWSLASVSAYRMRMPALRASQELFRSSQRPNGELKGGSSAAFGPRCLFVMGKAPRARLGRVPQADLGPTTSARGRPTGRTLNGLFTIDWHPYGNGPLRPNGSLCQGEAHVLESQRGLSRLFSRRFDAAIDGRSPLSRRRDLGPTPAGPPVRHAGPDHRRPHRTVDGEEIHRGNAGPRSIRATSRSFRTRSRRTGFRATRRWRSSRARCRSSPRTASSGGS